LIGGFLAEAAVIAIVIPFVKFSDQQAVAYAAALASLALVGVVATLLYVGLTRARPEPFGYLVAHGLKLLGGAAGGFVAGRRSLRITP
jgi:Na+/melibiose symporter-like transporter